MYFGIAWILNVWIITCTCRLGWVEVPPGVAFLIPEVSPIWQCHRRYVYLYH